MINLIVQEIKIIEQEYQSCQGLILSEDDLKCHLFRRIYDLIDNHNISTLDADITGSPLHTEVRFYDENGKLSLVPDITILDPAKMSIKHGVSIHIMDNKINYDNKLPSKGFEFGGKAIIIEIKFVKSKKGISGLVVDKIKKDLEKIMKLMTQHNRPDERDKIIGIMVVFNKTRIKPQALDDLFHEYRSDNLQIIYGTGNFSFISTDSSEQ